MSNRSTQPVRGVSRRTFLGAAAATAGAAALAGAGAGVALADEAEVETEAANEEESASSWRVAPDAPSADEIVETYDCDVLVIGLGHAGCCALRAAAENGAAVAAIVNQSEGSMSYMAGGQVGHINSDFLGDQGVPQVETLEFINDWQVRSNNRSNPGLVRNYATHCGECFDWLIDCLTDDEKSGLSVRQWPTDGITTTDYSGVKCWIGTANLGSYQSTVLDNCIAVAEEAGGKVFYDTDAYLLIQDDDGAVTGAYGLRDDGYVQVNAASTILATGDFSTDAEMCADLLNEIKYLLPEGGSISASMGRDGQGIKMGYWAGGRLDPCMSTMDGAYWYPCDSPSDPLGATAALWINAEGNRYSNEGFGSTELAAMPGSYQPAGIISCVFDSDVDEMLMAQPLGHMSFDYSDGFDSLHETMDAAYASYQAGEFDADDESATSSSSLYAADTIEELGGYLGYEGDALEAFVVSVERYNEQCEQGYDLDFGKDAALLFPVSTPPFYGYCGTKAIGVLMVTTSGLVVDQYSRVLGDDYTPIEGLYAAGNCSGCRFGYSYFTSVAGQSLSFAQTQGMMAGIHAATGALPSGTYVIDGAVIAAAAASSSDEADEEESASGTTVYTVPATALYANPVTGEIEDSGGSSNSTLGEAMVSGVAYDNALVEIEEDGSIYTTIRLQLADQLGDVTVEEDNAGDGDFAEVEITEMQTAKLNEGEATEIECIDYRFPMSSTDSNLRVTMYVEAMGRDCIFFLQLEMDEAVEGNTDELPFVVS